MSDTPTIILTAAEASGDQHASHLAAALQRRIPGVRLVGFGGPRMAAAGVELLADLTARSAMLLGSLARVPEMLAHYVRFDRYLERNPVALHIPVDSPTVNLPLAGSSLRNNVPALYYIAPQLWAWGAWRINKLRNRVDRIACILPFEPDYFARHSVPATFVGHPLFEPLAGFTPDERFIADELPAGRPRIALLPGSRGHEIRDHLPCQLAVAAAIRRQHPDACFVVAGQTRGHGHTLDLEPMVRESGVDAKLTSGRVHDVLSWADAAITVSGSVTLEVARFGVPMVVLYKVKPWQWKLYGRRLIKTPFMSLVNILAGREMVPELMPWFGDERDVTQAMLDLLSDEQRLADLRAGLKQLVAPLADSRASERTADLAAEVIASRHH